MLAVSRPMSTDHKKVVPRKGEVDMSDELMKRPKLTDEFVRRRAAELALPEVKRWMNCPQITDAFLIRDLERGLADVGGYDCAKNFEDL